jgi:hypothetical protein
LSQQPNPNDATPMIKLGAVAIIGFILVILGSCQMIKCACGGSGKGKYTYHCAERDNPKIKCVGAWAAESKKTGAPNCHDKPMVPDFKD